MKNARFAIHMIIYKVVFVLPISVLQSLLSDVAATAILLPLSVLALVILLANRPFFHASTAVTLATALAVGVLSNLAAFLVALMPQYSDSILVALLVAVVPLAWCGREAVREWLAKRFTKELLRRVAPPRRASRAAVAPEDRFAATPRKGADDGPDEEAGMDRRTLRAGVALTLDHELLGVTRRTLLAAADLLRRVPLASLSLRENDASPFTTQLLLGAAASGSGSTLKSVDLYNKHVWRGGQERAAALPRQDWRPRRAPAQLVRAVAPGPVVVLPGGALLGEAARRRNPRVCGARVLAVTRPLRTGRCDWAPAGTRAGEADAGAPVSAQQRARPRGRRGHRLRSAHQHLSPRPRPGSRPAPCFRLPP